ncbi:hypothetical protein A374_18786 [Fictibacillus macauensis ZFHKF-1]|uniref:Uncharacterized protein n=1 Tax=Fictibacillus macauensis ZFHKF-1 TaxID=1196324 RepID=I8U9Y6_9BACL|nr:hypothetical protein [Fictibacillus macauensis]EIT83765.1 hypothetical protein A374_18786 [Fictibacillus macauensis ZFHKF-1]
MGVYKKAFMLLKTNPMLFVIMLLLSLFGFVVGAIMASMVVMSMLPSNDDPYPKTIVDTLFSSDFIGMLSVFLFFVYSGGLYLQAGFLAICKDIMNGQKVKVGRLFSGGGQYFGRIMGMVVLMLVPVYLFFWFAQSYVMNARFDTNIEGVLWLCFAVLMVVELLLSFAVMGIVIEDLPFSKAWYVGLTLDGGYFKLFFFIILSAIVVYMLKELENLTMLGSVLATALRFLFYTYMAVWYVQLYVRHRKGCARRFSSSSNQLFSE